MKHRKLKAGEWVSVSLLLINIALGIVYSMQNRSGVDTESAARRFSRILDKRIGLLDEYSDKALRQTDRSQWLELGSLPKDMVIYRYCGDTLQSWAGEFPVRNDNLPKGYIISSIVDPRASAESPLAKAGEEPKLMRLGRNYYLVKAYASEDCKVISGLQLTRGAGRGVSAVNPVYHLAPHISIIPLEYTGGSSVSVSGNPVMKVRCDAVGGSGRSNSSPLLWIVLSLFSMAIMAYLSAGRTMRRFWVSVSLLAGVTLFQYFWGKSSLGQMLLFSPSLYAGGDILYSLGALATINLSILLFSCCIYIMRDVFAQRIRSRRAMILSVSAMLLGFVGLIWYFLAAMRSVVLNSGISLELYNYSSLSPFSVMVYISFITLLLSAPLMLQTIRPVLKSLFGIEFNAFSLGSRVVFSLLIAFFLVGTSSILGIDKEANRMEGLARRLSFDRDITFELRLRRIEQQIADDMIISSLSVFDNTASTIQSRISETYFSRREMDYSVTVNVFNDSNNTREAANLYNSILRGGEPIADNSRFMYVKDESGRFYYVGVFIYMVRGQGISRVLVRLNPREASSAKGYAGIFGINFSGRASLPSGYSYARYEGRDLKSYKGNYAYPTKMADNIADEVYSERIRHFNLEGHTHFCTVVGDDEAVMISREKLNIAAVGVAVVFVSLLTFLVMSILGIGRPRNDKEYVRGYFRTRILVVLLIFLSLTLVAMAAVSVAFVYTSNETNLRSVMSDKISSICSMIDNGLSDIVVLEERDRYLALRSLIRDVSDYANTDISIYSPSGQLSMTTMPMVFDRQMLGSRISGEAFKNIVYGSRRYYIVKQRVGRTRFYNMYAPVMNPDGSMMAILCSPYNEEAYDFERDAVNHTMFIFSIFILLLLSAVWAVSKVVDRMFKPLSEMSTKMNSADLESLEYIDYDRDDEISAIVQAYNKMVTELSESSRKLAVAERDKAWSGMARQVAHEIKNPLTPMKLQLQRVIRLKQNGNPVWVERFDEASKVVLDHIDILTDTANQFSTFAKLYDEEPALIDMDALIEEEISMFDNIDNIRFDYYGLKAAKVMGPKPQLTRVIVNLLGNAVQAIGEKEGGRVVVSLRKSVVRDGYYDIVVEDNGPGVAPENVEKLFSPNFTTKSAGSGLGLAISRSILERCGATIGYSRSLLVGGACFTICYPDNLPESDAGTARSAV